MSTIDALGRASAFRMRSHGGTVWVPADDARSRPEIKQHLSAVRAEARRGKKAFAPGLRVTVRWHGGTTWGGAVLDSWSIPCWGGEIGVVEVVRADGAVVKVEASRVRAGGGR